MKRTVILITTLALLTGIAGSDAKLTQRQRAIHALNRLAFGARPGDVDRVMKDGIDVWIEHQLHPELIPDRAVSARLAGYATLQMSSPEIARKFFAPILAARKEAKAMAAEGRQVDQEELRKQYRANIPPDQRPQRVMEELQSQRILRAAESDRQLNEVMVDFWMNHFNIFAGKGIDRFLLTSYERDTIRPRVWGRFEDMLMATAKSPAMLFYLDNAQSVADPKNRPATSQRAMRGGFRGGYYRRPMLDAMPRPQQQNRRKGGLNENYAREIMELHTLGVDGGYTQKDVTELARVFTGWTIARPQEGGGFVFRPQLHDVGEKTVLGIHFPAGGGMEEGERMIRVLAHQPATAHHIAYQLCQRLVADDPPSALVDRVARQFLSTDGDLRQTVKAVIDSPEFWDPRYYRAKVKSPFEYAISAVRAIDATIVDPLPIAKGLQQVGEPLYGAQPPTGYSDKAEAWVNTGALLNRLNFALGLAANKVPGVRSDVTSLIPADAASDADRSVDALAEALTGGGLTSETRNTIKERIVNRKGSSEDPWDNTQMPMIAGLILGSPEFQKQ
jgi:uncharacterized protein (DUF1800 family)